MAHKDPEKARAYRKEYAARPDVKARKKAYTAAWINRPGVRKRVYEKTNKYRRERYNPANKEKINQAARENYLKKKREYYERSKRWRELNPDRARFIAVRAKLRRYGLTVDDYRAMLDSQGNCCRICGDSLEEQSAHVDHCHSTGKVRAILCFLCNVALGNARDNTRLLSRMIEYLESFDAE